MTIDDVLRLSVEEGVRFFAAEPAVSRKIRVLDELGLGYLPLGQSATTLSGGEAQRIKTVLLIEHHMDAVNTADHVIALGPEGGHAGGEVVVTGTPDEVAACRASHTGHFLKPHLRTAT